VKRRPEPSPLADPFWNDKGRSDSASYTVDGRSLPLPRRWSRKWIESLSEDAFLAVADALRSESHYWSAFNLRTLEARNQLVYLERIRRYG
jgi:hypothetical protein